MTFLGFVCAWLVGSVLCYAKQMGTCSATFSHGFRRNLSRFPSLWRDFDARWLEVRGRARSCARFTFWFSVMTSWIGLLIDVLCRPTCLANWALWHDMPSEEEGRRAAGEAHKAYLTGLGISPQKDF